MATPKKLYIKTYGCQMNVYDSERMAAALAPDGYVAADTPDGADLIVLNGDPLQSLSVYRTPRFVVRAGVLATPEEWLTW